MRKNKKDRQAGVSLIEVLVVLVIVAVLVTIAIAQFSRPKEIFDRQNITRQFKVALERARFDSVKRRPATVTDQSKVTVINSTSFSYVTDLDNNGTLDATAETRLIDIARTSD